MCQQSKNRNCRRAYDRILKGSRTIADLSGEQSVNKQHLSEVVNYRTLDRNYWQ